MANELGDPTNVYYATTVDFRVFSDPVKWIDRKNVIIDSTMLRDDDGWWYRASKDSEITIERTRNPYATTYEVLRTDDPNEWSYVARSPTSSAMAGIPCTTWKGRNCSVTTTKT